jgi:hypothetical protein
MHSALDLVIYLFIMYTKFHKLVLFISSRAKHVMSSININKASALTINKAEFHQSFQSTGGRRAEQGEPKVSKSSRLSEYHD